jgi:hypothetical protein
MKIKLGELKGIVERLYIVQNKKFPVKISYAISKNLKNLLDEFNSFDNQRKELCEEYANKDEKGKPVLIENADGSKQYDMAEETLEEFSKELNSLCEMEVDIDIFEISASELDACDRSERYDIPTAIDLRAMEFMLKE